VLDESRKTREEVVIEASGAESQYDRLLTDVDDFLTDEFVHGGVPLEGGAKMGVGEKKARKIAIEVRNEYIKDLEDEIRGELGDQAQDQEVREYLFASLNMGKYLEEILLSWDFPMGEGIVPPTSAVAEAERRHLADIEGMYGGFPNQPGLLARVMNTWNKKWIPTLDPSQGFKPTLASLEDVHRGGQVFADPVARGFLGALAGGTRLLEETAAIQSGQKFTGQPTDTTVSDTLKSQMAEDILSEIISPEFIIFALPFAAAGVAARGTRLTKLLQTTSNLVGLGGLEVAGPVAAAKLAKFGLTSGGRNTRSILRGLTAVARNPRAIANVPQAVKDSPLFQRGLQHIAEVRAGDVHWYGSLVTPRIGDDAERFLANTNIGRDGNYTTAQIRKIAIDEGLNV
ncbi:hypothetical protein LCGC14_2845100, partial [marine sediment metagenome]